MSTPRNLRAAFVLLAFHVVAGIALGGPPAPSAAAPPGGPFAPAAAPTAVVVAVAVALAAGAAAGEAPPAGFDALLGFREG